MNIIRSTVVILSFVAIVPFGWTAQPVQAVKPVTATRESMALSYPEGTTISIKLQGTHRLPMARGEAKVERKKGETKIDIWLDDLKPASFFGGNYNTYVLWTVAPEGHVDNVGEFILDGDSSKLKVTSVLETFGMFVTAEPHFLVTSPSRFVVVENTRPEHRIGNPIQTSQIRYKGFDGVYAFERESLANLKEIKGERREDAGQARTAVALAERAGAEQFAAAELATARESLKNVESALRSGVDRRNVMLLAHETVRLALDAQQKAEERTFQASLDAERRSHAEATRRLELSIRDAQSDAERARLEAEQRKLKLEMEERARLEAQRQADEAARRAASEERKRQEEERKREEAEARARDAERKASDLAAARSQAERTAEAARQQSEAAQRRMQEALAKVAETRATARGLIVNIPDILFDFNKATLRPTGREVLSKISGILLVATGYDLKLEGHTDSIGSDEYNQRLSERRAESVRDYLLAAGIPSSRMTTRGFGKTQPIAPNTTEKGRQQNRRVEIVIEGVEQFSEAR